MHRCDVHTVKFILHHTRCLTCLVSTQVMIEGEGVAELCSSFISKSYASQGIQGLRSCTKEVKALLSQRQLPQRGWTEVMIERLLSVCLHFVKTSQTGSCDAFGVECCQLAQDLACMDSNNFRSSAGVGEREGRIACPLVARRHYNLAHGIGRSGDIAAEQPKVFAYPSQAPCESFC
jgi:O-phospho-L-seryl-tRNASec:L-selenocysteinyl-tRNA synthase